MYQYDSVTDPSVPPRECDGCVVACPGISGHECVCVEARDANVSSLPALEARHDGAWGTGRVAQAVLTVWWCLAARFYFHLNLEDWRKTRDSRQHFF